MTHINAHMTNPINKQEYTIKVPPNKVSPHQVMTTKDNKKNGFDAIFGKWEGSETDEEIKLIIEKMK